MAKYGRAEYPYWYICPSFMPYVAYGPFAESSKQLNLLLTGDATKGNVKSRAEKRKATQHEKATSRQDDNANTRGLTIDQRIKMASYNLQKRSQEQQENEIQLVALIAHESALARQIDAAERRATVRCKEYDTTNKFWNMVDELMEEQAEVTRSIKNFNLKMKGIKENVVDLNETTLLSNTVNDDKKKAKISTSSDTVLIDECNTDTDNTDSLNGSPPKVSDV